MNIYSLNKLFETGRLLPLSKPGAFFPGDPTGKTVMVMFAQTFSITQDAYTKFALNFPIDFESSIVAYGRTSVVRQVTLADGETGRVFGTNLQKVVNMDKTSRTSSDLTPQMLDKYREMVKKNSNDVFPQIIPPVIPSDNVFTTSITVRHSDMDFIFHNNQASYMRYALDCASEAASKNVFTVIKHDICLYHALDSRTLHMSESFSGDKLTIKAWEDDSDPHRLHFMMFKEDAEVYYSNIEFCDTDLST